MKVVKSGKTIEVNPSYGARMIEQGQAVVAKEAPKKKAAEKAEGDA